MRTSCIGVLLIAIPTIAVAQSPGGSGTIRISIEDAMRVVDRTSHPLAAARATSERTASDVIAARASLWPQFSLTGSYVRTLRSQFTELSDSAPATDTAGMPFLNILGAKHTWDGSATASQVIWDGGRIANTVALARSVERSSHLDVRTRRAQAVLDVTDAYYGAILAARIVAIGEASLANAERTLEFARLGYDRGTTAEFDVVRAEVTRDTQRTTLIRSRADREQAFLRLRQLVGVPFERPLELLTVTSNADELAALARSAAGVRDGERVTVGQARANVDIRRAEVGIARAARWPTINLVGYYDRIQYSNSFWPDGDWLTNFTVGVNVSFPLFSGFYITAEIRSARANQRSAEALLLEAAELSALDDARAISDAEVAAATFAASHRNTELARRAYEIAEVRYRQGVATYVELIDARIKFDQAQVDEASAGRDVAVTSVRLALLPALPVTDQYGLRSIAPFVVPEIQVPPPAALTTQPAPPTQF